VVPLRHAILSKQTGYFSSTNLYETEIKLAAGEKTGVKKRRKCERRGKLEA
jgi:hypothetical protein